MKPSMKSSSEFLTQIEVRELTGYTVQAKQREWLFKNDFPFVINSKDEIIVSRTRVLEKLNPPKKHPKL